MEHWIYGRGLKDAPSVWISVERHPSTNFGDTARESMKHPVFSVVIPTFNRAATILRAVKSVLDQSYGDFELIVVDDGSTDDTRSLLTRVGDERLRYEDEDNRGRSAARNAGVERARGRYVTFLDSDDEALPHWLEDFASGFASADGVGIVCSGYVHSVDGEPRHEVLPRELGEFFGAPGQTGLFMARTFAVRRELFQAVGGYTESLTFSENTELALRLVPHCVNAGLRIVSVNRPGSIYHYDRGGQPSRDALERELTSSEYILTHHRDRFLRQPAVYGYYLGTAGVRAARVGDFRKASGFFRKAIRMHPTNWRHYGRWLLAKFPPAGRRAWGRRRGG